MTKKLEIQFSCPDCGDEVPRGAETCPGCGLEIEWDDDDSSTNTVDSLLDEIIQDYDSEEGMARSNRKTAGSEVDAEEGEGAVDGEGGEPPMDNDDDAIPVEAIGTPRTSMHPDVDSEEVGTAPEEDGDAEGEDVEGTEEEESHPVVTEEGQRKKKLYASTFSLVGVLFVSLTAMFIIGVMVFYNWDTWIRGVEEASRGDQQTTAIYAAVLLALVFAALALLDVRRNKRGLGA